MRWLRFAAVGALVSLALFVMLASSVARRERGCEFPCFDPARVSVADRVAARSEPEGWGGVVWGPFWAPDPRWSIPAHAAAVPHFAAPELPFATWGFAPVAERSFLSGTDSEPRREVTVLVRAAPVWPERADRLGVREGWVLIELDISDTGAIDEVRVIDAAPRGVFEDAALRAVERWRYRPAVRDGRAVERRGIRVKLSFEREDGRT